MHGDDDKPMSSIDEIRFERLMEDAAEAMLRKDFASAVKSYERAAQLSPRNPIVQGNLERLRQIMG